ncbi:hypothetical protein Lal_00001984 [Lupinus albus]|nr:hypothetical protein Lal_00001984 [Lupinus albus]
MTRDNLYWLSHDQVALFKTFRGTASRCKQTINHAVPRIKQPSSLKCTPEQQKQQSFHQQLHLPPKNDTFNPPLRPDGPFPSNKSNEPLSDWIINRP